MDDRLCDFFPFFSGEMIEQCYRNDKIVKAGCQLKFSCVGNGILDQPVEKPKGVVVRNERGRRLCEEGKPPP
jgi:hypothetical protein